MVQGTCARRAAAAQDQWPASYQGSVFWVPCTSCAVLGMVALCNAASGGYVLHRIAVTVAGRNINGKTVVGRRPVPALGE